jgi:hypothetical protein
MLPLGGRIGTSNAATDSLANDTGSVVGTVDSTANDSVFPPVTGSPPPTGSSPKATIPGKSTPPTPRFGSIAINAPPEATLSVDNIEITRNRRDSLTPGLHRVHAVLQTVPDCPTAYHTRLVTVKAGETYPLTMTLRPCGLIEIRARGRSDGVIWFAMQPEGQPKPGDTPLTPGAKVFPVGKYKLWVGMPTCGEYSEDLEILPDQTITRTSIVLICPPIDQSR